MLDMVQRYSTVSKHNCPAVQTGMIPKSLQYRQVTNKRKSKMPWCGVLYPPGTGASLLEKETPSLQNLLAYLMFDNDGGAR